MDRSCVLWSTPAIDDLSSLDIIIIGWTVYTDLNSLKYDMLAF